MSSDLDTSHASSFFALVPGTSVPRLFRHTRREEWGLGIVVQAQDDRVDLQFQDGQSRSFKREFLHLLDPVEQRLDVAMGIVHALRGMSGSTATRADAPKPVSLDEQIAHFRARFPKGFADETYLKEHRGDGRKRPLKRHRDPLVALAAEAFPSRAELEALCAENATAVFTAADALVAATDLVSVAERKRFASMDASNHAAFADALTTLLFGEGELTQRFDAFVASVERATDTAPSWALATVFSGARFPSEQVIVDESSFAQQTAFMAPGLSVPERPMGIIYERLLAMIASVKEALDKAELGARDNLDVQELVQLTLSKKAQQQIREARDTKGADDKAGRRARDAA